MKVLLINTLDRGGAANACIRLHLGLLSEGIDSKLLVLAKSNHVIPECCSLMDLYQNRIKKIRLSFAKKRKNRRNFKELSTLPKGTEGFQFPDSIYDIAQHKLFQEADIIHLHWVANFINWTTFFRKTNSLIVWTLHDMLPFTGGYHYEKHFPFEAYRHLINQNLKLKTVALKGQKIEIVSPSRWLLNKSKGSELFKIYNHHLIPYGLNDRIFQSHEAQFARKIFNIPLDKKILLFVANSITNKRKGLIHLIDALAKINEEAIVVAVGASNNDFYEYNNVTTIGEIKDERLMSVAYSMADLFVLPSVEDNLPNTVIESLMCGTPVVAFNIGGMPDMVKEGENGYLSKEVNANSLAKTINKGLAKEFNRMNIRADAIQRFGQRIQAKNYIQLYQSLL